MRLKIIPLILTLVTLTHATLGYLKIHTLHNVLGVLTIPLVLLYYVTQKKRKLNNWYIVGLLLVFVGDYLITVSYRNDLQNSTIFFGIGLLVLSYVILQRMQHIKVNNVIMLSIPFLILYLVPSFYFAEYLKEIFFAVTIHNLGIGFFEFIIILKLINEKSFARNRSLLFSGICMLCMTMLSAYSIFVSPNAFLHAFGVIPFYSLAHYYFADFMLFKNPKAKQ